MKRVKFHPDASRQHHHAALEYDSQRTGLGDQFASAVHQAVMAIADNPLTGVAVDDRLRLKRLKGFRYYWLVFAKGRKSIWIIAVHHERQDDAYWQERLADIVED